MAQRRMFSKSITNSSSFLMMPQSSQNLYFHLGMNADDDGFCEHFAIMRMTESKPDDLKVLRARSFVKVFDDKVLVILDWKENNFIRKDRYNPSKYLEIYKEELKLLSNGTPLVDQRLTQVRLGKVRLGKVNNIYMSDKETEPERKIKENKEAIECIYTSYKSKINNLSRLTEGSRRKINSRLKEYSKEQLLQAIDNFSGDRWWMKHNAGRGVAWFFKSEDKIDQFLQIQKRSQDYGSVNPNLTLEEEKALDEKYKRFD